MTIRIMCLSDTHGYLPELDLSGIDLVLHAGDFTLTEKDDYTSQLIYFENVFCPWVRRISDQCPIYYIWGNHENFVEGMKIHSTYNDVTNYHCLHNNWIEFEGLKIAGTSYTPYYGGYGFNAQDNKEDLGRKFRFIPDDTDILISHGPPYGVLDMVPGRRIFGKDIPAKHAGSRQLCKRISEIKPKLVVFGHLHSNYGVETIGETTYVACSAVDELMYIRDPIIINI